MKINLYSIIRNEAKILPFWLQYYKRIADRIIVYDDQSDDKSREMLKEAGVELRDYPGTLLDDGEMAYLYSQCYREDKSADFSILVDADEFVWGEKFFEELALAKKQGTHIIELPGYEMWSDSFPIYNGVPIVSQIKRGERASWWANQGFKPCILSPHVEIGLGCGRHFYYGALHQNSSRGIHLKLLHYRNLGYEYYHWHHMKNAERLSPNRADKTWGQHNYKPLSKEEFTDRTLDSRPILLGYRGNIPLW